MPRKKRKPAVPDSIIVPSFVRRHAGGLVIVVVLVAGLIVDRVAYQAPQSNDQTRYHDKTFRVVHVVDGDTLDIDIPDGDRPVTRIRLWGVDTPEVGLHDTTLMHFGPEASEFAKQTLADRAVHVVLSPDRTRGKYGRLLAYVYLEHGGRMFNEMLIEEGYAYADLRFKHHYYKQFKAMDKRARTAGVGLWKDVTPETMPGWKRRFEEEASAGKP